MSTRPGPVLAAVAEIRELEGAGREALLALNEHVSDQSLYGQLFILSRYAADAYRPLRSR